MQISVLGAGAWGTALAKVLADKDNPTLLWSNRADHAAAINEEGVNHRYLPIARLPKTLRATASLEEALTGAELVVVVVPSHALRGVMRNARPHIPQNALICSATKGIENDSQLDELCDLGCDMGQGYHLSRPLAPEAVDELLSALLAEPGRERMVRRAPAALALH